MMHSTNRLSRRLFLRGTAVGAGGLWLGTAARAWGLERVTPEVKKDLIVHTEAPMNAEPALTHLCDEWITPLERFYVRSHAKTVPDIDVDSYRVTVEGMVERPLELSLDQLRNEFQPRAVVATLTCAGNRRNEFDPQADGVQWQAGAIGNALWKGVRLIDVLKRAGLKEGAKHIWFESLDEITEKGKTFPFGASIPLEKTLEEEAKIPGALLAFEMNGQPLPTHHGYPLRTVVPGYIGARSVKWLGRIVVSDRPSPNHYVADAYKLVKETTPEAWQQAEPLYRVPINSFICEPAGGATLKAGRISVRGYALGNDGQIIDAVQVTANGGGGAVEAKFTSPQQRFAWQFWKADVPVTPETTSLTVSAIDRSGISQPKTIEWNAKGYMYNAQQSLPISVK